MENNKENPTTEEFLQIYPNLTLKFDYDEKDKLIKFFNIKNHIKAKKSSVILDEFQIQKLLKEQNKSDIASINIENKEILSIQKINNRDSMNPNDKILYRIYQQDEDIDKYVDKINEDFYLINKGIELQKRNLKRTVDVKKALELFFENSELIQKVSKNYGIKSSTNPLKDTGVPEKVKDRIRKLISNLANNVLIEKYKKDKFIIKKNDVGKDCYFLLNGKASILKPVEYKYIKMNYEDYFKYLLNLKYNKEIQLLEHIMNINWNFIKIYNQENLIEIVKYFIQMRIAVFSNISFDITEKTAKEDLTLEKIESYLYEFKLKFEDFSLSKEKIISDLNEIDSKETTNDPQQTINNYFINIFQVTKSQKMLFNSYDYIFEKEDNEKNKLLTVYKYEKFLILGSGAFFGEMSLNTENKKRNSSIRTETDCIIASLSIDKYIDFLYDENKKILSRHINFICNNFFFNNISKIIFIKYYFSMFKLKNFLKDDIIYEQASDCNSVYFIIDGFIKYEINASILEIHNIISFLITELKQSKSLKLDKTYINDLRKKYLKNHGLIKMRNANIILLEKINKPQKFELNTSETYEILGLCEFFFGLPHICKSSVISKNAKFFEISNDNLNHIISYEMAIKEDLNKLVLKKMNVFLGKLFNIENNYVTNMMSKIDTNFYEIYDTKFFNDVSFERQNFFKSSNNNGQNNKNKIENIKKKFNQKEELLIIKKFSKNGYIDEKEIKDLYFYHSPIKFSKEMLISKSLSDMQNNNMNNNTFQENQKSNLKQSVEESKQSIQNNLFQKNENKIDNINLSNIKHKKKLMNVIDENEEKKISSENSKSSAITNKLIKEKTNENFNKINNQKYNKNILNKGAFLNIGKSSLFLPKLRKLLISTGNLKEDINMSIVKNLPHENCDKVSESQQSMQLNEIDDNNKQNNNNINTNDKVLLPGIKRQNSCLSFPIKNKIKRKINKKSESNMNHSEMSIHQKKEKNILAKYIKDYYQKKKILGYLAIVNPINNSLIKKKLNNNFLRLIKK